MTVIVQDADLKIERLTLGSWEANAYLLTCPKTAESVIVDAPAAADVIMEKLKGTRPRYVLLTHNHSDHTGASSELSTRLGIPGAGHRADFRHLSPPSGMVLADGDKVTFGNITLEVLHTPGHTPGSLCFRYGKYLLAGDTIFPGGPGRTWSPESFRQIVRSITEKILPLPDDTQLYPGHGGAAVLGEERKKIAAFAARPHHPEPYGDVNWLTS